MREPIRAVSFLTVAVLAPYSALAGFEGEIETRVLHAAVDAGVAKTGNGQGTIQLALRARGHALRGLLRGLRSLGGRHGAYV